MNKYLKKISMKTNKKQMKNLLQIFKNIMNNNNQEKSKPKKSKKFMKRKQNQFKIHKKMRINLQ